MTEFPSDNSTHEIEPSPKEQLAELLEGIAPKDDYEGHDLSEPTDFRQMEKHAKEHEKVIYPSDNPKESITILAASGRWNVSHRVGRKNDFYWVNHDGSVLPLQASDLAHALEIDTSRPPQEVDQYLLDLIQNSSTERPVHAKRSFGKGVLTSVLGRNK
mgnify:CR=1 FL=1